MSLKKIPLPLILAAMSRLISEIERDVLVGFAAEILEDQLRVKVNSCPSDVHLRRTKQEKVLGESLMAIGELAGIAVPNSRNSKLEDAITQMFDLGCGVLGSLELFSWSIGDRAIVDFQRQWEQLQRQTATCIRLVDEELRSDPACEVDQLHAIVAELHRTSSARFVHRLFEVQESSYVDRRADPRYRNMLTSLGRRKKQKKIFEILFDTFGQFVDEVDIYQKVYGYKVKDEGLIGKLINEIEEIAIKNGLAIERRRKTRSTTKAFKLELRNTVL